MKSNGTGAVTTHPNQPVAQAAPQGGPTTDRTVLTGLARRAMVEGGLEPDFPGAAVKELAGISGPAAGDGDLRDLRSRPWVSIDNDDSRDLDQLTVAEDLPEGRTRILVAVADVDALVRRGSALDDHAAQNTTSVYTPAAIFPMLPERLSTNLTSLNEDEDRLAVVADMVFGPDAALITGEIYRARVRNYAKLAYHSVGAWLAGTGPAPERVARQPVLEANLRSQDRVAQQLRERRHRHGALSLETIEAKAVFGGDGLTHLEADHPNRATQLIEEFMVAANGVAATFLAGKKFPSLRRVLRDPERWARLVQLAAGMGGHLPAAPDSLALENFLNTRQAAAPDKFPDLSLAVVKLIGRGEYALDVPGDTPPGHFALAVRDYSHSTAPNRRFPDLITQRLLKAALADGPLPYTIAELTELAGHCTEQEAAATKVERRVDKSAAALLLSHQLGQVFDGIITGAADKGTWVRILRPATEGRVVEGFQGLRVGDHVRVKLLRTDVPRGFIDFARA